MPEQQVLSPVPHLSKVEKPEKRTFNRENIAQFKRLYDLTRPAPWKKDVLVGYGIHAEDAEWIVQAHENFAALMETMLSLMNKLEVDIGTTVGPDGIQAGKSKKPKPAN